MAGRRRRRGSSLELVNPTLDNAFGRVWRASLSPNGTPGAANSRLGEPVVIDETPARETSGVGVTQISVTFSSAVRNVAAADLTVDGAPAKSVTGTGAGPYVFTIDPPKTGIAQVALGAGVIESAEARAFAGDHWQYFTPPTTTLSHAGRRQRRDGGDRPGSDLRGPADNILGIDMTVAYDPAVLTPQNVTASGIADLPRTSRRIPNLSTPGMLIISEYALGRTRSIGSGEVARIQFLVVGSPSTTSSLTFTSASINEGETPGLVRPRALHGDVRRSRRRNGLQRRG